MSTCRDMPGHAPAATTLDRFSNVELEKKLDAIVGSHVTFHATVTSMLGMNRL